MKELNNTFLALIPKKLAPESLNDYRPISLVGSMYKVLAKVLANRMKKVMCSVIGEIQTDFVENRQIIDSFVKANEIIHKWKYDQNGGLMVKLDFEKAYDSIDFSFLDNCKEQMGFGIR